MTRRQGYNSCKVTQCKCKDTNLLCEKVHCPVTPSWPSHHDGHSAQPVPLALPMYAPTLCQKLMSRDCFHATMLVPCNVDIPASECRRKVYIKTLRPDWSRTACRALDRA